jgi:uncharacterized membrane protein
MKEHKMIKTRWGKIFLLPFVLILLGVFMISCEKPAEPDRDAEKLNKLT